jgi:carboxylesterase type B
MTHRLVATFTLSFLLLNGIASAQKRTSDVAYLEDGHERHVLDIYAPENASSKLLPVMFWIHGGGWQADDKSDVALKPTEHRPLVRSEAAE